MSWFEPLWLFDGGICLVLTYCRASGLSGLLGLVDGETVGGFAIIPHLGDLVRKCDPVRGSSLSRPASVASALEATRNCTTSLILQHLLLKVGGFAIIQYLGDLARKCDPVRGSSLSRPASVASA